MRIIFKFAFVLLLFSVQKANAESNKLFEFLDNLKVNSDFSQTLFDQQKNIINQSYGKFNFKSKNNFTWHIEKPSVQIFSKKNDQFIHEIPSLDQKTIYKSAEFLDQNTLAFFTNDKKKINTLFDINIKKDGFELIAKDLDMQIASIRLYIKEKKLINMNIKNKDLSFMTIDFE